MYVMLAVEERLFVIYQDNEAHLIPNDNSVDLTPPRLSLAANNTHYTGD